MSVLEDARAKAKERQARVVLPELGAPVVAEAAGRLEAEGLAQVVPLAPASDAHVDALLAVRDMREGIARRMVEKPLIRAAAMVAAGEADAMVAGAEAPTRRVIEAASLAIGLVDGVAAPSSFFLMAMPDGRALIFADCAVTVSPDAETLAGIASASATSASALLGAAKVAMLSFSTGTSGTGDSVDVVRAATEAAQAMGVDAIGPVQADAALNPVIAAKKGLTGSEGVNTLVFPSLDAGNIAYKLVQELGGAQAVGPFLQGFAAPVCDLSRGATADDIVAATMVTAAMVPERG